jgi:hypothetical protein
MKAGLEDRLRLLEDERSILRTLYTYGHSIDYGYEEDFVDCWVPDGVLIWPGTGPIKGHAALRAAFRAHTHAPTAYHKHVMVEPLIRIDGARASSDCMFTRLDPFDGGPGLKSFGRYRDKLVRCEDERWRFVERSTEVEARRPGTAPTVSLEALRAGIEAL